MITDEDRMIAMITVRQMSDWTIQESIREYNEDEESMDEHDWLLLAADLEEKDKRQREGRWNPVPPPHVDELYDEFPAEPDEEGIAYANRLQEIGLSRGILRQCSLGWHDECSKRRNPASFIDCKCQCHGDPDEN